MRPLLRLTAHAAALAALAAFGLALGAFIRDPDAGGQLVMLILIGAVLIVGLRQIYRPGGLVRPAPVSRSSTAPAKETQRATRRPKPPPSEPLFAAAPPPADPPPLDPRVDINSAGLAELARLPGIGPVAAQRIVDERDVNGPFDSVEELVRVPGLGPAKVRVIAPEARV